MFMTLLLSLALAGEPPLRLHPIGDLHGDETEARDGQQWLALLIGPAGARLQRTQVRVEAVEDALLDAPGELTGRRVTAPTTDGEPLLLLAGGGLREGPVVSAMHAAVVDLRREPVRIELPGQPAAELALLCDPTGTPTPGCALWLEQDGQRQQLAHYDALPDSDGLLHAGDDAPLDLQFAGDLDGDGRLDLIFDTSEHYNVLQPTLFLSGAAGAGELLRAVARHRRTGC
jgi:hypothetical protein